MVPPTLLSTSLPRVRKYLWEKMCIFPLSRNFRTVSGLVWTSLSRKMLTWKKTQPVYDFNFLKIGSKFR